jgi:hypothetical protein
MRKAVKVTVIATGFERPARTLAPAPVETPATAMPVRLPITHANGKKTIGGWVDSGVAALVRGVRGDWRRARRGHA